MAVYNVIKAFVESLTRSLAVDHGPAVRCNAVSPGWIMTGMLFHLGAGEGGITAFLERYADSFNTWWDDLGVIHLNRAIADEIIQGLGDQVGDRTYGELTGLRDGMITAIQSVMKKYRHTKSEPRFCR